jgi:nucleotide-binding universal stress UspA family protein
MYKTILVPLDGSHRAETILAHAEALATAFRAKIVLLQVVEPNVSVVTPYDMVPYYDPKEAERMTTESKGYLATKEGELRALGIEVKSCVENGPVVAGILDVAEREHADLIAMASHGRTGLGRVFYGSVAAGVLHKADRPLLLIRSDD